MKCAECPARQDQTDENPHGLCKVGVNQATIEKRGKSGCQYNAEQVNRWLKKLAPPTVKDVLLKTWAQDTETMAKATVDRYYDDEDGWFVLPDGFATGDPDAAIDHYIAYLNSAAEVGK